MKYILSIFIAIMVFVPTSLHAAGDTVWFSAVPSETPSKLNVGDPILVYAKLNNVIADPITYVLAFTTVEKTIGTKVVTVAGYTGQDVSIKWVMPATSTTVTATIAKATDKNKKELKALVGPIGTATVGVVAEGPDITPIKGWIGGVVGYLESFRIQQLVYFTTLKQEADVVLTRTTVKDVTDLLQPESPDATSTGTTVQVEKKDNGTSLGYLKLIYATSGKAFFGHKAVYFVAIILLALLVIRLFFKLLFR